jgi:hypothetical protein
MNVKSQLIQGIREFDSLFFEFIDRLNYPFRKSRFGFNKEENTNNSNNSSNSGESVKSSFTFNPIRKGTLKRASKTNSEETMRKTCIQSIYKTLQNIVTSRQQLGAFYQDFYSSNSVPSLIDSLEYYENTNTSNKSVNISNKSPFFIFLDNYAEFVDILEKLQTIPSCKKLERVQRFVKKIDTKQLWEKLYTLLDLYDYSAFPENSVYAQNSNAQKNKYIGIANNANNNVSSVITQASDPKSVRSYRKTRKNKGC